jgi:uncharacterized protein
MRCVSFGIVWSLWLLVGCSVPRIVPTGKAPTSVPAGVEVVKFRAADGVLIEGWYFTRTPALTGGQTGGSADEGIVRGPAVLFCHGVRDSVDSMPFDFVKEAGYPVLCFDYRGFGNSGSAVKTNLGFAADAWAALEYLRSRADVDPGRVAVVGHSMGAAYALAVGARAQAEGRPVRAIIAGSGFSSWRYAANAALPGLGYLIATSDGPDPVDWIAQVGRTPVMIAHAEMDDVMPIANARRLQSSAMQAGVKCELVIGSVRGHNAGYMTDQPFQQRMLDFLAAYTARPTPGEVP